MGYLHTVEFAEATRRGQVTLDTALSWHLTVNHYPPVPRAMIAPCTEAIAACTEGDPERNIALPEHATYRGCASASASEIVETFHLEPFVDVAEDDARVFECDASPDCKPSPR